jgi:diguanylate cyclase (GGDEF)-like protein
MSRDGVRYDQFRGTAAPKRPVKRLIAAIIVVALCFCVVCGKVLLDARRAAWERAAEVATSLVATLKSEIARNIESYDLSMVGVIENLRYPEITQVSPELRQAILFDRSTTAKHLHAIVLLDENGIVRLDSRTPFPEPVNRADRDYFQVHKNGAHFGLYISQPIFTPVTHHYVIAVSRRLSHADGSFAGAVVGAIRLSYFQQLFKDASLGPGGNITLSRTDGTLLARWPYQEAMLGRDLKGGELYKHLAIARSGRFETNALTDGVHRLVVYSQIDDLPLVIGVGQSTADIYAEWRSSAFTIGLLMALLCAMSIVLALYLAREMRRRSAAETTLAVLAMTDSLTGLANRRQFDDALEREWRRAIREQLPLALVMCDADLFKSYNDRHGHLAGDNLLQAIGIAMNQMIRRGTDVAARYGGDEFAVLLPGASADDAVQIAEQVRCRFAEQCLQQGSAPASLSIGVASVVPSAGEDQASLVAAADEAAYRAKKLGRDRSEVAPILTRRLSLVADSDRQNAA